MPRLSRRNKVVSIRLSDDEYDQLRQLCAMNEADNISELARRAMKRFLVQEHANGNGDGKVAIESRVDEIHAKMSVLDREVEQLCSAVGLARLGAGA